MEDKITIDLKELERFADLLIAYGQKRDHVSCENCGLYLKDIFLSGDEFVKSDIHNMFDGIIEYIEKPNN